MSVSFDKNCLHFTTMLAVNLTCINIRICQKIPKHVKILQKKVWPVNLVLFVYISMHKQLQLDYNLYVHMSQWLRGNTLYCLYQRSQVCHKHLTRIFYVCIFVLLLLCFNILEQKPLFVIKCCHSFRSYISLVYRHHNFKKEKN